MYICICKGLKELDVKRMARLGVTTPEGLIAAFGLDDGKCCGRCARRIDRLVALANSESAGLHPVVADSLVHCR